jgi:hypothetical protein
MKISNLKNQGLNPYLPHGNTFLTENHMSLTVESMCMAHMMDLMVMSFV